MDPFEGGGDVILSPRLVVLRKKKHDPEGSELDC